MRVEKKVVFSMCLFISTLFKKAARQDLVEYEGFLYPILKKLGLLTRGPCHKWNTTRPKCHFYLKATGNESAHFLGQVLADNRERKSFIVLLSISLLLPRANSNELAL